jgi:hypothetical protein
MPYRLWPSTVLSVVYFWHAGVYCAVIPFAGVAMIRFNGKEEMVCFKLWLMA